MSRAHLRQFGHRLYDTTFQSTSRVLRACYVHWLHGRTLHTSTSAFDDPVPLRKHLKEEARRRKADERASGHNRKNAVDQHLQEWELTVGIEVHAQLNTRSKLFSDAAADVNIDGLPNHHVATFDAALPGSQPVFQLATLIPAIRAALALGCTVQHESSWDRKHYFHWDQPNGYQITQYYRPFAKDGQITLRTDDGVPEADLQGADSLCIGIKQIQMEQDTAKTTQHPGALYHIDLNRAGHPLIEIITLPEIHSPKTAAAVVRKLHAVLHSVDACVLGMELGGLRADVNVSVRRRGTIGVHDYSRVQGLGQRTEIKNLSSFKAIEDAVIAERDRQIEVLEAGGSIAGETRGWTLGATSTTRLRGKEGEVDYRYSPDADLAPLLIDHDLVDYIKATLPELPDATMDRLQRMYGLSAKDARTIIDLDDGHRLELLEQTVHILCATDTESMTKLGRIVGNWVIHELGGLLTTEDRGWDTLSITSHELADIIQMLMSRQITARSAKLLLPLLDQEPTTSRRSVQQLVDDNSLRLRPLDDAGYQALARKLIEDNPATVAAIRDKGQRGKAMWFVGQMVRQGEEGTIEPEKARYVIEREFGLQ